MDSHKTANVSPLNQSIDECFIDGELESLDERLMQALAQSTVSSGVEKETTMAAIQQPGITTDPEKLFKIQQDTSDYNIKVSLISTLTRKAVGAVETVLRA